MRRMTPKEIVDGVRNKTLKESRLFRRTHRKELARVVDALDNGRECGSCTKCCELLTISSMAKNGGDVCPSLRPEKIGKSCSRYGTRPNACQTYWCNWRLGQLPEDMRPDKCGFIVHVSHEAGMTCFSVTLEAPGVLVQFQEFFLELWAQHGLPVVVRVPRQKEWVVIGSDEIQAHFEQYNKQRMARRLPVVG